MSAFIRNLLWTGTAAVALSMATAAARSRVETRRADTAFNAQSHIVWGGRPPTQAGPRHRNTLVGATLHIGAGYFWAGIFETLLGRWSRRNVVNAVSGAAAVSSAAYLIDYELVPRRVRPGFEFHLSRRSLRYIYAALAVGMALGAICSRRDHPRTEPRSSQRCADAGSLDSRRAYSTLSSTVVDH